VSLATIKRLESQAGPFGEHDSTVFALRKAFEDAGVEFLDCNGGGLGVPFKR
jgi:hypothetical protein